MVKMEKKNLKCYDICEYMTTCMRSNSRVVSGAAFSKAEVHSVENTI